MSVDRHIKSIAYSMKKIVEGGTSVSKVKFVRKAVDSLEEELAVNWIPEGHDNLLNASQPFMGALADDSSRYLKDIMITDLDKGVLPMKSKAVAVSIEDKVYVASSGNINKRVKQFLSDVGGYLKEKYSSGREARILQVPASEKMATRLGGPDWFYYVVKCIGGDKQTYVLVSPGNVGVRAAIENYLGYDVARFYPSRLGINNPEREKEVRVLENLFGIQLSDARRR